MSNDGGVIFAYGFNAAGFPLPGFESSIKVSGYELRYIDYNADVNLADADGVIFMSGIFETEKSTTNFMEQTERWFECDDDHLALREKQIFQLFQKGGWAAVLLRKVTIGSQEEWSRTDLAKRLLCSVFEHVRTHEPNPHVRCKRDEFRDYLEEYGISQTAFGGPRNDRPVRIIAETNVGITAAEVFGSIFFLPERSLRSDFRQLNSAVSSCALAVTIYKQKNQIYLPSWAEALTFSEEIALRAESETIQNRLLEIERAQGRFRSYKATLSSSGNKLRDVVIQALRDFFNLNVTEKG